MAFTAYIFEEDYQRLISDLKYSSEGGSLYGLWTSDGNPVIRVAFSFSLPKQSGMAEHLSESYMLCHIGEWRPVRGGHGYVPREDLLSKCRGRGTPERFVVVDVTQYNIEPIFNEKRDLKGQGIEGIMERLSGENPFNRVLTNQQAALRHDPPPYHQSAMAGQEQRSPGHARSQSQKIDRIKSNQWYSSDRGNEKIQYVFQKFQEIARPGTKVEMFRDTVTHDMSMEFTDSSFQKWEVKFPSNFPRDGATLINKSQSVASHEPRYQTSYGARFGGPGPAELRVTGSANIEEAVKNIIYQIRKS